MSDTFRNRMPGTLSAEFDEANGHATAYGYADGLGPYVAQYYSDKGTPTWAATDGFTKMVASSGFGKKFKWTLNTRGDLAVISPMLKHAAASGGGDVLTGGHGWIAGVKDGNPQVTLDNDTGHYWTTEPSLKRAVLAWTSLGYAVVTQAFKDPKLALAKMFK